MGYWVVVRGIKKGLTGFWDWVVFACRLGGVGCFAEYCAGGFCCASWQRFEIAAGMRMSEQRADRRREVLAAVSWFVRMGERPGLRQLKERTGLNQTAVQTALKDLEARGEIVMVGFKGSFPWIPGVPIPEALKPPDMRERKVRKPRQGEKVCMNGWCRQPFRKKEAFRLCESCRDLAGVM